MTPAISLVAWGDRTNRFIFVAVPNERGRYLRTDHSVIHVQRPHCKSVMGEPCRNDNGRYVGSTHYMRRRLTPRYASFADYDGPLKAEKPHYRLVLKENSNELQP